MKNLPNSLEEFLNDIFQGQVITIYRNKNNSQFSTFKISDRCDIEETVEIASIEYDYDDKSVNEQWAYFATFFHNHKLFKVKIYN